jgi:uncharacterized protein (DUF1330 family)
MEAMSMTKKGYWIAMVDITDPDTYRDYVAANAIAFEKYGATFLVRGGKHEDPEGPTGNKQVVIEFESYEQALACYHSPEYQDAMTIRLTASTARLAVVEGV